MAIRPLSRRVLLFGALLSWGGALAAEITLYEEANFGGEQLTLRGNTPNIGETGFHDHAASVVVGSGRWELCSEPHFKGTCATFTRGEYAALDARFGGNVNSAREIGSYKDQTGSYNDDGRGAIQLFSQPDFRGVSVQLKSDAPALSSAGFNNHAASMIVTSGTWQLCVDPEYGGDCRTYTPGRYGNLGYGMAQQVSSARLVRSASQAPVVVTPGVDRPAPAAQAGRALLYSAPGLAGASLAVAGPMADLGRAGFDGATASLYVESGTWVACSEANYRGHCQSFAPGRYDALASLGLERRISSIRPVADIPVSTPVLPPSAAVDGLMLFSEPEFAGARLGVERDTNNLARREFANRASSAIIYQGTWELCTDEQYGGQCAVYRPGRYPRMGGLTGKVASLRRIQ